MGNFFRSMMDLLDPPIIVYVVIMEEDNHEIYTAVFEKSHEAMEYMHRHQSIFPGTKCRVDEKEVR